MRRLLTILAMTGAMISTASCADDFQWQGKLAPGQLLEIRGVMGGIHAQGTSGNMATVTAQKTGGMSDPSQVKIQVVPYSGGVVICAIYPDAPDAKHKNVCNPPGMDTYVGADNNDVQVEFTVSVPQGVLFTGETLNGDVEAKSVTADVNAGTLVGDIDISTTGGGQATTLKGSITASIGSVEWKGVRMFDAHGDVDLQIPSDANVEVQATAFEGTLTSDFPLKETPFGKSAMASGELGSGGRSLRITAFEGNLTLRKGPASGK